MAASIPPILLLTTGKTETLAILAAFATNAKSARRTRKKNIYYELGVVGGAAVWMVECEPGSGGPGGALLTARQAIQDLHPQAVILCGLAYGLCPERQPVGQILVAKQIQCYEPQTGRVLRGDRTTASERLLYRVRSAELDWDGAPVECGLVLSGEKQADDPELAARLLAAEPAALGVEMEGAGLYGAARDAGVEWILIKAIGGCAGRPESPADRATAAQSAAGFVRHTLQVAGWEGGRAAGSTSGADIQPAPPAGGALQPFPAHFAAELPHPLACACAALERAANDGERFAALDGLLVNLSAYLLALALGRYWQDRPDSETLRRWLGKLSTAHRLTTLALFDRISAHYAGAGADEGLGALLFEPYRRPAADDSPLRLAWQALAASLSGDWGEEISPGSMLRRLLALREQHWEAAPAQVDPTWRERLLPVLRQALEGLIEHFRPLWACPLVYVEAVTRTAAGRLYTLTTFPGAAGTARTLAKPWNQPGADEPACRQGYLYWCTPDGTPRLNLHPFLIEHHLKLFFWEQGVDKDEIDYRHCASAERYCPPEYYHFLSPSWRTPAGADGDAPAAQLERAREEQRQADRDSRIAILPVDILLARLTEDVRAALAAGLGEAVRTGQFWLGGEFALMGLTRLENGRLATRLAEIGVDGGKFRGDLRKLMIPIRDASWRKQGDVQALGTAFLAELRDLPGEPLAELYSTPRLPRAVLTPRLSNILRMAVALAGEDAANESHLLRALLAQPQSVAVSLLCGLLVQAHQDPRDWIKQLEQEPAPAPRADAPPEPPRPASPPNPPPRAPAAAPQGVLTQLGRDLTALALAGKLRPAVGESARKAMTQIGLILQQTQANNPILLGDPGVGKTAVVEGLAWRLANDPKVIARLAAKRVIDLSPNALVAGMKYRGALEERLGQLLDEVRAAQGQIVVFIDEIHTLLSGRGEDGLANALKPALARGEFPCIGATTVGEYRRYIESDPALARRFTPVWLEEPSSDEATEIAAQVARDHLGPSHQVEYPAAVIAEAVRLAVRYLHDEFLPGKVIKLLDQAGPLATMGSSLRGNAAGPTGGGVVSVEIVRRIVAERTGIPLASLNTDERTRLLDLEATLKQRVKGQDEAVVEVTRMVKRARAGLADPKRPLGVFLFAGPSGVGKTELALALAEALFDQEDAILRLDMSEYLEKHQISRLIGSPPGYIGHEEEGQLTGRLRRRPYSVVLLDEIEKAHPDVQHLFLQLFDAGRLTDSRGRVADGRNAIFILTTNLGAREALGFADRKPYEKRLQTAIEEHFTPEFLGRISRVVYFNPLDENLLLAIFDKFLAQAAQRFAAQGIRLEVAEAYRRALCQEYADPKRGARPLQRAIEDEIIAPLTDHLLAGELGPGMSVVVLAKGQVEAKKPSPALASLTTPTPPAGPAAPAAPRPSPAGPQRLQVPPPSADEAANQALLTGLVARFERETGLTLNLADGALEILCSPLWLDVRRNLATSQAFEQLVCVPLRAQIQAGDLQPGDRIEVIRNVDKIDFKKRAGGPQ